jgi:ABC-type Fe3+/spermidine/putrescine transport system ATPase subunit
VGRMTYLGNARVYTVKLDWMEVEVREENRPGAELHAPGTDVTVSWDPHAISVVADS